MIVDGLTVERGGRMVLRNLAFTLAAGETVHVAGRNGSGKSTLLRTLAGLLHAAQGTIRYTLASDEVCGAETAHYLGYEDALKPALTVRENLDFWAVMLAARHSGTKQPNAGSVRADFDGAPQSSPVPGSRHARLGMTTVDALAAYGIARLVDLPAGYLSAGQKRRVALARLLLAPRPIWLLDEPLIALDAGAQETMAALMAAHAAAGGAILVASHQPLAATRTLSLDS